MIPTSVHGQSPRETSFLVFSDDWGEHPSSCQHLFRRISQRHKVLWVNTIGMRNPKLALSDFKKAFLKVRKMLIVRVGKAQKVPRENVISCQPVMLPFAEVSWVRRINCTSVIKTVRRKLRKLDIRNPILVTTVPNACDYIGKCGESKVIYYCVDDFSEWPGLETKMVREMEEKLIQQSDCHIATSQELFDRLSKSGKPTYLLTHGVDTEHFKQTVKREHLLLDGIPRPRIGYYGLFDERSDHGLLAELAARMPDVSFVITGQVDSDFLSRQRLPNVYFTGSVRYADLPSMLKGWDVLMLPYKMNDLTKSISPLKLKEYLITGKPVVSTPIPEVLKLKDYVSVAATIDEWIISIRLCLDRPQNATRRPGDDFWTNETWEKKAEYFLQICRK